MKLLPFFLLLMVAAQVCAQSYPVTGIIISLPANPDASIANWKTGSSMLTISAMAKVGNGGRIDPSLESSRILLTVKKSGGKACGSYTGQTAPPAGFNSLNKVWSGANAVSLFGQDCTLPPGEYELCVQFFGNGPAGPIPQSDEKCKQFTIKGTEQQVYQPPQPLMPANQSVFTEADASKPITFRWLQVMPAMRDAVTYRLRVWQLMPGQNSTRAIAVNTPIVSKDVENFTQTTVQIIKHDPDQLDDEFIWNVQALNRDGKPIGENNGTGEVFTFKRQHKPIIITKEWGNRIILVNPVNDAPIVAGTAPTFVWKLLRSDEPLPPGSRYKIKIVEIKGDQSPEEALRTNKPFFEKDSLNELNYKPAASLFNDAKKYAWVVEAKTNAGVKITESEINEFTVLTKVGTGTLTLSAPANGAVIPVGQLPGFSWSLSGRAEDRGPGGGYKIKIVEIKGDESPENALRSNKPFFEKDSISTLRFQYPASAGLLKPGGKYAWQVTSGNLKSNVFTFQMAGAGCGTIDSDTTVQCKGWNPDTGLPVYTITITLINTATNGSAGCNATYNSLAILTGGGTITGVATLPMVITPGNTATVSFNYSPATIGATTVTFRANGNWSDPLNNTVDQAVKVDLPVCYCKDCDNAKLSAENVQVTPVSGNPAQYNIAGGFSFSGLPANVQAVEVQVKSFTFNNTPTSCSNGIQAEVQSGMLIKPSTAINNLTPIFYNVTVSNNTNISKDVKLIVGGSGIPLPASVPFNLTVGVPAPLTGLPANCCKMNYTICFKVLVYYGKTVDKCKYCEFTFCKTFSNQ
jgi:hypothetical protein